MSFFTAEFTAGEDEVLGIGAANEDDKDEDDGKDDGNENGVDDTEDVFEVDTVDIADDLMVTGDGADEENTDFEVDDGTVFEVDGVGLCGRITGTALSIGFDTCTWSLGFDTCVNKGSAVLARTASGVGDCARAGSSPNRESPVL